MNSGSTSRFEIVARRIIILLIVLGFLFSACTLLTGWNKSMLDLHGFRQTQTLITSYYFLKEGFTLAYQNPIWGKPWEIPMEFPLYQALVALVVKVSSCPLLHSGRAVSLFFWVATVAPLYGLLRVWVPERLWCWAGVLLVWSTPTYLMWSRTPLIESTALFFALAYLYAAVIAARKNSIGWWSLAIVAGIVAGVVKSTTFAIALVPLTGFVLWEAYQQRADQRMGRLLVGWLVVVALPMAVMMWWTQYADAIKALNPDAQTVISTDPFTRWWIFGNVTDRLHYDTWRRLYWMEMSFGLGRSSGVLLVQGLVVIVAALWYAPGFRSTILILLAGYLTAPLIFTHIFYVHEYYHYENQIYLLLAFVISLYALSESLSFEGKLWLRYGALFGMVVMGWLGFRWQYQIPHINPAPGEAELREELRPLSAAGNPDDVLLIIGGNGDPAIAYYSERKAITDPKGLPLNDPIMRGRLERSAPNGQIAAMIVLGDKRNDAALLAPYVAAFGLEAEPIRTKRWGDFYVKRRDVRPAESKK